MIPQLLPNNHTQSQLELLQRVLVIMQPVYKYLIGRNGIKEIFLGMDNSRGSEELLIFKGGELFLVDSGRGSEIREGRSREGVTLEELLLKKGFRFRTLFLHLTQPLHDSRLFNADGFRIECANEVATELEELISAFVYSAPTLALELETTNLAFVKFGFERRSSDYGTKRHFYEVLVGNFAIWCPIHRLGACNGHAEFSSIELADTSVLGENIFALRTYANGWGGILHCQDCGNSFVVSTRTLSELLHEASTFLVENGKRYELV